MKGYLSVREISYKWNVSERWVSKLAQDGRIPGVERFGRSWAIPEDAEKPADPKRGIGFVGPVITYSFLQAIGIVNDHLADCEYR